MLTHPRTFTRTVLPLATLTLVLVAGLGFRLFLAPHGGYGSDISINKGWAESAATLGFAKSYQEQLNGNMIPNYPPLSILMFGATGHFYRTFFSPEYNRDLPVYQIVIKLPAIFSDILTAFLLFLVLWKWKGLWSGTIAATLFSFNPAVIFNSAVWGQTDSFFTLFVTASLTAYVFRIISLSSILAGLSALAKAQAVSVFPLFVVLFTVRLKTFLIAAVTGLLAIALVLLPFYLGGSLPKIWDVYVHSVGYYPTLSSAAYNFWWTLFADAAGSKQDTDILFGIATYRTIGLFLFASFAISSLVILRRQLRVRPPINPSIPAVFLAATVGAFSFFLFNTEMHERYLFPFTAVALPTAFLGWPHAVAYITVSLLYMFNMMGVLPYGWLDRALFNEFPLWDAFIAQWELFIFFFYLYFCSQFARQSHPKPWWAVFQFWKWKVRKCFAKFRTRFFGRFPFRLLNRGK